MARLSAKIGLLHPLFAITSAGAPIAMILPASRHITRSEKRITACMMCSIMMMVMSSSPRLIRRSSTSSTSEPESPAIASSEIRSFGRAAIARASSILRSSTWLSVSVGASALEASPIRVRIDIASSSSGWLESDRGEVERHHEILEHRHAVERPRDLEAARDAAARAQMRRQLR